MLIDIHVHCHKKRHPKVRRQEGSQYPTPERLIAMMDKNGVDMAVLMCSVSPECRNTLVLPEEVLEICAMFPDRFIPFFNLDGRYLHNDTRADFRPLIEAYIEMGCKGVGEYFPNMPFDDPRNMNLFAQVQEYGLPLTFHIAPKAGGYYGLVDEIGLPRLERVLKAFPNLILLGHSTTFWAEISSTVTEENRKEYPKGPVKPGRVVELMREYPNLHGDLSAGSGYNAISRDPEFGYAFMEEFQDRLYWGTDIANDPQEPPNVQYFQKLRSEHLIPTEVWQKITSINACRLLNLRQSETKRR